MTAITSLVLVFLVAFFSNSPHSQAKSDQMMNVRVSPLGLVVGYFNADVDFRIGDTFTIGPTASYWNWTYKASAIGFPADISTTFWAVGLRGNWYPDGVFEDGFYATAIGQYGTASATSSTSAGPISASTSAVILSGLAGFHWFWDSFNLNIGGGFASAIGSSKIQVEQGGSKTDVDMSRGLGLAVDFMLGWAF